MADGSPLAEHMRLNETRCLEFTVCDSMFEFLKEDIFFPLWHFPYILVLGLWYCFPTIKLVLNLEELRIFKLNIITSIKKNFSYQATYQCRLRSPLAKSPTWIPHDSQSLSSTTQHVASVSSTSNLSSYSPDYQVKHVSPFCFYWPFLFSFQL